MSSDAGVARVNSSGLVTAVKNGVVQITARTGSLFAEAKVTVSQVAARIEIIPQGATLRGIGAQIKLVAVVMDSRFIRLTETPPVSWSSRANDVATVDENGLVTAVGEGVTVITARSGRAAGGSRIEVALLSPDRDSLIAFYHSTGGPGWTNNGNWLSEHHSIDEWTGVVTNDERRVVVLEPANNMLTGTIPPEIGQLDSLRRLTLRTNRLTGEIPAEIGQLKALRHLDLGDNRLTGEIPAEIGQLSGLIELALYQNQLTEIPPEIGQLDALKSLSLNTNKLTRLPAEIGDMQNLEVLYVDNNLLAEIPTEIGKLKALKDLNLGGNRITGAIPPEIGQLSSLISLILQSNELTGEIPSEIGQLKNLEALRINGNRLTGKIPPEVTSLFNLQSMYLHENQLSDVIPDEIGSMMSLRELSLSSNQLTGAIPPGIGQLVNLERLGISLNRLTGQIPQQIGNLENLRYLYLQNNQLSGNLPPEIGRMKYLMVLNLSGNTGLSGVIPEEILELSNLDRLSLNDTSLCLPQGSEYDAFLSGLTVSVIPRCDVGTESTILLTQATQSIEYPVPLVAGEDALLRVFVLADEMAEVDMPSVLATFYMNDGIVHTEEIRAQATNVPSTLDLGSLSMSANAVIPGSILMPGLELVVEIDPDEALDSSSGIQKRVPVTGRMPVEVIEVPLLELALVPFVWSEDPDLSVVASTAGLTTDDDLFRFTRDLLPVRDFQLRVTEPLHTSVDPVLENKGVLFQELQAFQKLDGSGGHYMGILRGSGGSSLRGTAVTVAGLYEDTIAHELGHNFSLFHAPCGTAEGVDSFYPYPDGNIGAWGYDLLTGLMVSPDTPDLMSYCGPPDWISDYNFSRAIRYRRTSAYMEAIAPPGTGPATRTLLLWGGLDESGEAVLNPAFVVDASPSLPAEPGPFRIVAQTSEGDVLFSLDFNIAGIPDSDGGAFAYLLPIHYNWRGRIDRINLYGMGSSVTLDAEDYNVMALLRDAATGQIRGFMREDPDYFYGIESTNILPPEPNLDITFSKGIPDPTDWEW